MDFMGRVWYLKNCCCHPSKNTKIDRPSEALPGPFSGAGALKTQRLSTMDFCFQSWGSWADFKWSEITLVIIEIFHPLFFDRYIPPEIKLEFLFVYTRWSLGGWIMICLVLSKLWSLFVVALFWRYIQRLWRHLQVYWISLDLPTKRWTFKMSVLVADDFGWFLEVGWWTYS